MVSGAELYEYAQEHIPEKWFEKHHVAIVLVLAALFVLAQDHLAPVTIEEMTAARVAAVLAYVLSNIADTNTTRQVLSLLDEVEEKYEIQLPLIEHSIFLPNRPDSLINPGMIAWESFNVLVALLFPYFSMAFSTYRTIAITRSNQEVSSRLELLTNEFDDNHYSLE